MPQKPEKVSIDSPKTKEGLFMATRGRRVHAIEKSILLLDCFWQARSPLSLSELERMTGWAKSTIHGLLNSMLDSAVVEQNASDGKYRLGYHLFELGNAVSQGWNVPEVCKPHLQQIVDQIGESAYLARLSGEELILVECEEPHVGFCVASEAGTRLPLHCSSQGKAILAHRPVNEVKSLLRRKPLSSYTSNTLTDPEALMRCLPEIRRSGIAEEHEEYKLGLQSVAAPIFDRNGTCSYAIGIICTCGISENELSAMRSAVASAAQAVSLELGWQH